MQRREYLLGLAAVGSAGVGGYLLTRDGGSTRIEPRTVPMLTGDHSERRVPTRSGITVLEFFSTTCTGCPEQTAALEPFVGEPDVQLLSLTPQAIGDGVTRAEVRQWWDAHGGQWPVGVATGDLASAVGVSRLPAVTILTPTGAVHWIESGVGTAAVRDGIEQARPALAAST
jgi:hypothetical protein